MPKENLIQSTSIDRIGIIMYLSCGRASPLLCELLGAAFLYHNYEENFHQKRSNQMVYKPRESNQKEWRMYLPGES